MLSLSSDDLIAASEEHESIFLALEKAQDYLNELEGAPICDYNQIYLETEVGSEERTELAMLTMKQRFQRGVRKVIALN